MATLMRGLDASAYQNTPDWAAVPSNREFAYLRLFEWRTGQIDSQISSNALMASASGRIVGGYHRADPTKWTAAQEARRFIGLLGYYGLSNPGRLRPAIDIEPTGATADANVDWPRWTREFFAAWRDLTTVPLRVYSSGSYFASKLGGVEDWPSWVDCWVGHSEKYSIPTRNMPAEEWAGGTQYTLGGRTVVHQYSVTGLLPGITKPDGSLRETDLDCLMPGKSITDLVLQAA